MPAENPAFEITPRIVPADEVCEITVCSLDPGRFASGQRYEVQHFLMEGATDASRSALAGTWNLKPDASGRLRFRSLFSGEQEHWIRVISCSSAKTALVDLKLFSVRSDLFERRPFKGDFHLHSNRSDGKESPAYVAAACRRIGMDFMAVTDHHRYAPSIEAVRAFKKVSCDIRIFPGEEVHPPGVSPHLINYGGRFSVNDLFSKPGYRREIKKVMKEIGAEAGPSVDLPQAAACLWSCRKIREAGGLAIYCHPHWIRRTKYDVPAGLNQWMFDRRPFDALELIGGYFPHEMESNQLQTAWFHDQRQKGFSAPVLGASDSHGCETGQLFGWYWTIVFSPSPDFSDLMESVRRGYSVAVETLPGQMPRAHGEFRLVKYALFLLRTILPRHDALCMEEGRLMLNYLSGEPGAAPALKKIQGQCARLYWNLWSGSGSVHK